MEGNLPNEFSTVIPYSNIVECLDNISKTQSKATKKNILKNYFDAILKNQKRFYDEKGGGANGNFYPFLRLFIPSMDLERRSYGIQVKTLGKQFVQALGINSKSQTAKRLTDLNGVTTDYGDIVFDVMKDRSPAKGTLSVYEVNKYLDLIADHFKDNERGEINDELVRMLNGMTALDRKWLTRTLLKKLHLGIDKPFIFYTYHKEAWDLFNRCSRLSKVCAAIESDVPLEELKASIVDVFDPLRSMLCERGYISKINQMLADHEYYLETKMDGERCQLHVRGTEFKYFSRSCKEDDLTKAFGASGELSSGGLYSPYLYLQLNGKVKSAIFDGEMMVWDRVNDIFCKKAENFTAKHLKRDDQRYRPCFCIYDLLYLDGESLINKPYAERIRKLQTIITEQKGALMLCQRTKVKSPEHFLDCLNKAYESNEEGVVMKQAGSKYQPGQRENGGWFKMKPDYENSLISDFDLLIIGGYYNDNRTTVKTFLLAVLKKAHNENDTEFHAVCRIRNGITRAQFCEILDKLEPYKRDVKRTKNGQISDHASAGIDWANANPDVWYDPKHSIVLQIKASELIKSAEYRTTHSFRFPRVIQIRWDKMWYDACSLNEFQTFCSSNSKVEKLTKRQATSNDLAGGSIPKRQRGASIVKLSVASNQVEAVDSVCRGIGFYIVHDDLSKKKFEDMVRRHGGAIHSYPPKNPNPKTFVIVVNNPKTPRAQEMIRKFANQCNIVKIEWLVRALGSAEPLTNLIKFTPNDVIFATPALQDQFDAELDTDDENDSEPMIYDNPTQAMDQINEHVDGTIQSNIENNGAQHDIFQTDIFQQPQTDASSSQLVQTVARDEPNRSTVEADNEGTFFQEQAIASNDEAMEIEQVTATDVIYEEATQLMENEELPNRMTDAQIENEQKDHFQPDNDRTVAIQLEEAEQTTDELDEMSIFRSVVGYFFVEASSSDYDIPFAKCMIMARGGIVLETADDFRSSESPLTHIFVANTDFNRNQLRETVQSFGTKKLDDINVIRYQWVLDCSDQKKRLCDTSYKIVL